ncbi:hypothetical protein VTJ49DRAFT_4908 [Mycothermus thermophilus]|uniref:Zn(2)-C6 fungal-type domain-containing protein n=1 Tax=Humicola insolens TaxID=85995 RepID=A0ABR3V5H4_HUMIN
MNSGRRARSHSRPPRSGARPRSQSIAVPSRTSPSPAPGKSKRVRTGCLTCRERHLKCDEAVPECNNCQKSNRECRRGIRLNFLTIQVSDPPRLPSTADWSFQILDESRSIAAEYEGGLGRYPGAAASSASTGDASPIVGQTAPERSRTAGIFLPDAGSSSQGAGGQVQVSHGGKPPPPGPLDGGDPGLTHTNVIYSSLTVSNWRPGPLPPPRFGTPSGPMTPSSENMTGERDYLNADDDIHLMQVFVDDVAIWMDALDKDKHFTNTVPYMALKFPMVFNALLACGAQHLALTGAGDSDRADYYYGLASSQLQRSQHDRDRDLTECALTAVVLNAYDIMNDKPAQRMQHIASTRALLMECGWDASSGGLGAACFWVNVGMEVLSCLSFGWPTAWDPDQWGLDLEFASLGAASRSGSRSVIGSDEAWRAARGDSQTRAVLPGALSDGADLGNEELWVHRIFYIMAKIANFRANTPQFQEPSPHDEQVRLQTRYSEWRRLQNMCHSWNLNCPRSMRPYGYSPGPSAQSLFPNVWLIKPAAKLGRLFYHTSMAILAQTHPLASSSNPTSANDRDTRENRASMLHHAHHVCGIVAHARPDRDRDRGVVLMAVRCLAMYNSLTV